MFRTCLHILFFVTLYTSARAQVIPADRRVDWTVAGIEAGIELPITKRNVLDYGAVADGITSNNLAVQNAISSLSGQPGIIYFPAGNYFFNDAISLSDGIVLKGDDAVSSTLTFNLGGVYKNLIRMVGTATGTFTPLTGEGLTKGSDSLELASVYSLNEGDYVEIRQEGGTYLTSDWAVGALAQINKIKSVSGNKLTLQYPLRRDFDLALNPRIQKVNLIQNAGVVCLKIIRQDVTVDQTSHIQLTNAANCMVRNCWLEKCNFAFIAVGKSIDLTIDGNYFYNAYNWGEGGKAYGVSLEFSSGQVLVENNIFRLLRHSVLLQTGASGNVVAYNYSRESRKTISGGFNVASEDFTCHGNYPFCNLFEGNIGGSMKVDDSHGINGRFNTLFRNKTTAFGGLTVAESASDSQNVVGNQITGSGQYSFEADGHFLYGNNRNGNVNPPGTTDLPDSSYYLPGKPGFWNIPGNWYGIGYPNTSTASTIPAEVRYNSFINGTISDPTAGCLENPLPFHLLYFRGDLLKNGVVQLQWQILNSTGQKVEIQRSNDGNGFSTITNFKMANSSYTYNDNSFQNGVGELSVYYRLKFTDVANKTSYSNVAKVLITNEKDILVIPSLTTDQFYIFLNDKQLEGSTVVLMDAGGRRVHRFIATFPKTTVSIHDFAAGMYMIRFKNGTVKRIVKQ